MRSRDFLFLLLCAGALWAFQANVFPSAEPRIKSLASVRLDNDDWRATVERVDAAFNDSWREQHAEPATVASDLAVARRVSLALTGTIPSLEEIRHFESLQPDERLERWIAERLADRRYADYVAERLARATVGVEDGPFLLYRRRRFVAWMSDQLAANQPYDGLVRHLIADSGLWTDTPATNFITVTIQPEQNKGPDPNQLAARVSRAFLGVRMDCAECHDHPFEPWKQRDFQSLAAFFGQTRHSLRGIRDVTGAYEVEDAKTGEARFVVCQVPFSKELLSDKGSSRQRLAAWVTHPANRFFARETANRAWALLFGRPLVEPVDNLSTSAPLPLVLEILANDFAAYGFDWQRLLTVIASTRVFRLDSKSAADTEGGDDAAPNTVAWAEFPLTRLRPEQVVGALLQSASLATIDAESQILVRLARAIGQREFVERYGDSGAEEFEPHGGTIPQRLLMMNGKIVGEKTKDSLLGNAATRIAVLAPDDATAIEVAFLAVLTRRPNDMEAGHFAQRLAGSTGSERNRRLGDLVWALLNSTEFSWNH